MDDMQHSNMNQGNMQHGDMGKFMHNTFWLEDRICVAFAVNVTPDGFFPDDATISKDLHLQVQGLNENIKDLGFSLNFFNEKDKPGNARNSQDIKDKSSESSVFPPGVYLFRPPIILSSGGIGARGVSFLRLEKIEAQASNIDDDCKDDPTLGPIPRIVNRLNCRLQKQNQPNEYQASIFATSSGTGSLEDEAEVSISSAAPTYLCGATSDPNKPIGQGCPLSPPIPLPVDASCSSYPGLWPITLPELPADLQSWTGDGVTVFVLDTLPSVEQIKKAAQVAGDSNLLLQDIAKSVKFSYPNMVDGLDLPGPRQVGTGKDIYGRLFGFKMPDHGIFVAGIIRDVAPKANIECFRVLNDLCIGSVQTIIDVLNSIHDRMSQDGDLYNKPVVINMSLVIPDDDEVTKKGLDPSTLDMAREPLLVAIQSLVDLGAIFVASAGNEGDLRYNPMNITKNRPPALYPAAYAYPTGSPFNSLVHPEQMIPVGAVNKDGNATEYSCYPGAQGVATYGGDLPKPEDIEDGQGYDMTSVKYIDAPIGLYTSPFYPALSIDDPQLTYPAPNASGWAYWIGTSFATPIVSAIAARALEAQASGPAAAGSAAPGQPIVMPAATRQTRWTELASIAGGSDTRMGPMIWAVQCKPDLDEDENEDEDEIEVEINITEVNIVTEQDSSYNG